MGTDETQTQETSGWRPEEGDTVSGKVVDLDRGWSDYSSSYYPIVTLEREDGSRTSVHAFHQVLRNRLANIAPKLGDPLTITYVGKKDSKDGKRQIAIYKVEAPNRVIDAAKFWGSVEGAEPTPGSSSNPGTDVPIDSSGLPDEDEDIPF